MVRTGTARTADATLYYEVRGSGPFLILTGAPMKARSFAPLADPLATGRTVLTHDPRGIGRSRMDDPGQDSTPESRADDLRALMDTLGVERADVFGSSGGGVTALAAAERHPGRLGTVVAHEPPVMRLHPRSGERLAATDAVIDTYRREGAEAAFRAFAIDSGFATEDAPPPPPEDEHDLADRGRFLAHELRNTVRHSPDTAALSGGPARVVVGLGADSAGLTTFPVAHALAAGLGTEAVLFPGGHTGFTESPNDFAARLKRVLRGG